MFSQSYQNFVSIQTKTILYNGIKYYILVVDKWDGYYEYPSIRENWTEVERIYGYIFQESEYMNLLNDSKSQNSKASWLVSIDKSIYNDIVFLDYIQSALNGSNYNSYVFRVNKVNTGLIRFQLPGYGSPDDIEIKDEYFELKIEDFNKIILK